MKQASQDIPARRGVLVRLEKRGVCCFCREYLMAGSQAYRFAKVDPHKATIEYRHAHITCADVRGERGKGEGTCVSDAQILKFWRGMEVLNGETKAVDRG